MASYILTADASLNGQRFQLLCNNKAKCDTLVVPLASVACFDHVVRSLADLPTPSAGAINLTAGSWCFAAPINLGANKLVVPNGVYVYLQGSGYATQVTATGTVLQVDGECLVTAFAAQTSTSIALQVNATGRVASQLSYWFAALDAVAVRNAGLWEGQNETIVGQVQVYDTTCMQQSAISTSTIPAIQLNGGEVMVSQSMLNANGAAPSLVELNSTSGICQLTNVDLYMPSPTASLVNVTGGVSLLQVIGGYWHGSNSSNGNGLLITGPASQLQLSMVTIRNLSTGVRYTSGSVTSMLFDMCNCAQSNGFVGVNWPAASIPGHSMLLVGNSWYVATPISGFTAATANVNLKACAGNTGLLSETPIVP